MPRTTALLVGKIVRLNPKLDIDTAIEAANSLVTSACAGALADDGVTLFYDDARLELIERYLSAHFYCINDPRTFRQRAGQVSVSTQYKVDLGLNVTHYGQQAMILDSKGGLAALNAMLKKKGSITLGVKWLGTLPEDNPVLEV